MTQSHLMKLLSMKFLFRLLWRSILVIVIALIIALIATDISEKYFVKQYMVQHHITNSTDLAGDYAFGLEDIGQVVATFIISFSVSAIAAWGMLWPFWWRNRL